MGKLACIVCALCVLLTGGRLWLDSQTDLPPKEHTSIEVEFVKPEPAIVEDPLPNCASIPTPAACYQGRI